MRFVIFTHSLVSDWNHGNAHFLRGIATELLELEHEVRIFEPRDGWSRQNLLAEYGESPLMEFAQFYPRLHSTLYEQTTLDLAAALEGADVVLVHEWNAHDLVRRIGQYRAEQDRFRLFFHDTHHRSVTDPAAMARFDLRHYDGVLAYGGVIRDLYVRHGWTRAAWTWHEAADTRVFRVRSAPKEADLVWIGNWGDGERSAELREFLIEPVRALGLKARVYGVRYPAHALQLLSESGIEYGGWLPNYRVPEVFSRYRVTVHIPRRPYVESLPGIPTIRPFEAMACGIPLVSAPWQDSERLFRPGLDFLVARDRAEMTASLQAVLCDESLAQDLAAHGLETIQERHTCAHRTAELLRLSRHIPEDAMMQGAH
uniref:Spore protein YkvP/CgeB glycosyl transferase-like domain-containing protein n=1 Tax=Solibacter usitatus (strain Ellin6076) TaxID=234267 RepID=Q022V3_SOLUE